jgi:type II secretory pathway pseudopilin PulG
MKRRPSKNQSGFALILFVLALMGIGGLLLVGLSKDMLNTVETKKFEHNKRVLEEAKQALLQSAYNYPITNGFGPGRLPNADTNNDGVSDGGAVFGRLPWAQPNLNLYDIRDADGARLWYVVSSSFRPQTGSIHSDTSGTITLRDQSGQIIYDGSNPSLATRYGVAALIIAPGAIIDRNGVTQVRSVANVNDPVHYLDLVTGTEDNATYTANDTDGFILGPVNNLTNDQFIVITADEVIEVAEKATMQAYRTAVNEYLTATGNVYPWLYNYKDVSDVANLYKLYPTLVPANFDNVTVGVGEKITYLTNIGRIPTIAADYFTDTDSEPIETQLSGSMTLNDSGGDSVTLTELTSGGSSPGSGPFAFNDGPALDFETTQILTDVAFDDLGDPDDGAGRLTTTFPTPESFSYEVYFWDEDISPTGFWTTCPGGADQLSDCIGVSATSARILHLTITLDFSGTEDFDMDYTPAPAIAVAPATGTAHASITGTYAANEITSFPGVLSATYEFEQTFNFGFPEFATTLDTGDGTYATGTVDMTEFTQGPLSLGMRYYPEFPAWVFTNGWHRGVRMAYAQGYRPDGLGACTPGDLDPAVACLQITGLAGTNNDIISLLILASERNWVDGDVDPNPVLQVPADGSLDNDIGDVFNLENSNLDGILDMRIVENAGYATRDQRLDKILVIEK